MYLKFLLSLVVWIPIAFAILTLLLSKRVKIVVLKSIAIFGGFIGFLFSLALYTNFTPLHGGLQFEERYSWIPSLEIFYHLGVDGISMPFVILNSFITLLVLIACWDVIQYKIEQYLAAFLLMSGLINGAFSAVDSVLFYVFFEAMLIPMYIIIGVWGGPNRVYASVKFFLYTLLGSLLLLVAILFMGSKSGGFDIFDFYRLELDLNTQRFLFIAFFMSFAVKVPMWPVHTWLPDAHVEAPTGGSMILAAITLKLGAYGFLRFALPIVPDASRELAWIIVVFSIMAILYVGLIALVQTDMKKLVAYSSISHMGFVTLGMFLFTSLSLSPSVYGIEGALLQMISHGFVSAAMFMCIGILYDRVHSRNISDYGGVVNSMPIFSSFMLFFAMANAGLPGTSGFVGEFLVILGAVEVSLLVAGLAATTLVFGAAYTLWMYKRVIFGEIVHENIKDLKDVNFREFAILTLLAVPTLAMGIYPEAISNKIHSSVNKLSWHVSQTKIGLKNEVQH